MNGNTLSRRSFLGGGLALSGCASLGIGGSRMLFGDCTGPEDVPMLADLGYDFWEWDVPAAFVPEREASAWAANLRRIRSAPLPLRSCKCFLPKHLRLTGPDRVTEAALKYAVTVCRRADEADVPYLILGSSRARNAPKDYPIDAARTEFTDFCKRLAERVADCRTTVVLEPLQPREANYLNFVTKGAGIVRTVGSPRLRVLADFYHMLYAGERAEAIRSSADVLVHCHIAEYGTRKFPTSDPARNGDYAPFFAALRDIGYTGGVSCECGWPREAEANRAAHAAALAFMRKLA